jgi:hypothetical protein
LFSAVGILDNSNPSRWESRRLRGFTSSGCSKDRSS